MGYAGSGCMDNQEPPNGFRKKIYTKMYHSSISALQRDKERPTKKIIPSTKLVGIREEFKKTFLPLLIDVFELRQVIRTYKNGEDPSILNSFHKAKKSPQEILERLTALQLDIEESRRWCEGVILQIAKGIEETKEALQLIEGCSEIKELDALSSENALGFLGESRSEGVEEVKEKKSLWKKLLRIGK